MLRGEACTFSRYHSFQKKSLEFSWNFLASLRDNVALLVVVDVKLEASGKISSSKEKVPLARESTGGETLDRCLNNPLDSDDGVARGAAPVDETGKVARLVVANTHLLFNPKRGDVKMAQLMLLTQSVER